MNANKRKQIMDAAESLFSSRRFHEITVEEIARKAGVGKGTIYRYFQDKDALFFEVVASGYDQLYAVIEEVAESGEDFKRMLLRVSERISEFHRRRLQWIQMGHGDGKRLFGAHGKWRNLWTARFARLVEAVSAILVRGRDQGLLRTDVEVEVLSLFFLSLLRARGLAAHRLGGRRVKRELLVDFFCHGACACAVGNREESR
ncbi:MAG: TetR/AcrR family transcriptional regulator [Kiritimatiellaeota bacterium]|nr:TetR/AcrR family transcriptional regulator [Kiritimatiellota bacterium]